MKGQKAAKAGRPRRSDAQGMMSRVWARWLLQHTGLPASEMAELAGVATGGEGAGDRRNMWYRWQSGAITPSAISLKNLQRELEGKKKLPSIQFLLPNGRKGEHPSLLDVLHYGPYSCWWLCGMVAPSPDVSSAAYYLMENIVFAGKGDEDRLNAAFFVSALCEHVGGYSSVLTYLGVVLENIASNKYGCFTEVSDARGSIAFRSPTIFQDSWWQLSVLLAVGFYGAYEMGWGDQSAIIDATAGLDEYEYLAKNFPWIDCGLGVAGSLATTIISKHFSFFTNPMEDAGQGFLFGSGRRQIQFGALSPDVRIAHSLDDLDFDYGFS